jgi:transposase-like protein
MIPKKIPKDVELKENIEEAFLKDDFKVSDQVPALYEKMMSERSGRSSYRGKMTPARYEAIIKYIRNGAHLSHAANAVGIDDTTVYRWVKWGIEDPESLYGLFVEDLQRAKGLAILRNVTIVQRAAEDDWIAAKWLLSVLDPEVFGNKSTVKTELSAVNGGVIESGFFISDEELKKLTKIQDSIEEENKVVDVTFETLPDEDSPHDADS